MAECRDSHHVHRRLESTTAITTKYSCAFVHSNCYYREDDQIVGALLRIPKTQLHNYGRYLCRIEIGNAAHRLEMSASLYGTPIEATRNDNLIPVIVISLGAVLLVLVILFLIQFVARTVIMQQKRQRKLKEMYCSEGFHIRGVWMAMHGALHCLRRMCVWFVRFTFGRLENLFQYRFDWFCSIDWATE